MKKTLFTVFFAVAIQCIWLRTDCFAQVNSGASFAYDVCGNRISKVIIYDLPDRKFAGANSNETEIGDENYYTDFIEEVEIKIYPNPTVGNLKIEFPENVELETTSIEIYGMNGTMLLSTHVNQNPQPIDITEYANGVYLMRINNNGKFTEWKIIKQ